MRKMRRQSAAGAGNTWIGSRGGAAFGLALAALTGLASCSRALSEQARMQRAMVSMDHRDYGGALVILEEEHQLHPDDRRVDFLLAQANLGLAHFELPDFVAEIEWMQNRSPYVNLDITPTCDDGTITRLQTYDVRCLFYRVLQHLPDVDDPRFMEAHLLLENSFPDSATTPDEVNLLAAVVDLTTALYRIRTLIQRSDKRFLWAYRSGQISERDFHWGVFNLKSFLGDATAGLRRLRHSYVDIRQFIVGTGSTPLIRVGGDELDYADSLSLSADFRFTSQVFHDRLARGDRIARQDVDQAVGSDGSRFFEIIERLDRTVFESRLIESLLLMRRLDRAFLALNTGLRDPVEGALRFPVADFLWAHPPRVFQDFEDAVVQSWRTETRGPLLAYLGATRNAWRDLLKISNDWNSWFHNDLTSAQQDALRDHFESLAALDPRFTPPPEPLSAREAAQWESKYAIAVLDELSRVLRPTGDIPDLTSGQITRGRENVAETLAWLGDEGAAP